MTERKRATGFALMDTAFAADAKFVRLARKAKSEVDFAACVGVFWLILADARRAKSHDVSWDDYTEYHAQITALKEAKLLTEDGFAKVAFDRWAPAYRVPQRSQPYPNVPDGSLGTKSTNTSTHISSSPFTEGVGGAGEGERVTSFMRMPPKPKPGSHEGQHTDCSVCDAARPKPRAVS